MIRRRGAIVLLLGVVAALVALAAAPAHAEGPIGASDVQCRATKSSAPYNVGTGYVRCNVVLGYGGAITVGNTSSGYTNVGTDNFGTSPVVCADDPGGYLCYFPAGYVGYVGAGSGPHSFVSAVSYAPQDPCPSGSATGSLSGVPVCIHDITDAELTYVEDSGPPAAFTTLYGDPNGDGLCSASMVLTLGQMARILTDVLSTTPSPLDTQDRYILLAHAYDITGGLVGYSSTFAGWYGAFATWIDEVGLLGIRWTAETFLSDPWASAQAAVEVYELYIAGQISAPYPATVSQAEYDAAAAAMSSPAAAFTCEPDTYSPYDPNDPDAGGGGASCGFTSIDLGVVSVPVPDIRGCVEWGLGQLGGIIVGAFRTALVPSEDSTQALTDLFETVETHEPFASGAVVAAWVIDYGGAIPSVGAIGAGGSYCATLGQTSFGPDWELCSTRSDFEPFRAALGVFLLLLFGIPMADRFWRRFHKIPK